MLLTGLFQFDIVGFREASAVIQFAMLTAWSLTTYAWLGFAGAVAALLLAVAYSPLAFYSTWADGTFAGFYGWANASRYFAALLVVVAFCRICIRPRSRAADAIRCVALGAVLAAGSWMAQENLSTTIIAGTVLVPLLILTDTVRFNRAASLAAVVAAGFLAALVPALLWYAARGVAGEFVRNYFLPRAVASGYTNMWWPEHEPTVPAYYLMLPFLISLAIATLWRCSRMQLIGPLDDCRCFALAVVCVQIASFQTTLFRSDSSHLMNSMIALPLVIVVAVAWIPRWIAATALRRAALTAGVLVIAWLMIAPG